MLKIALKRADKEQTGPKILDKFSIHFSEWTGLKIALKIAKKKEHAAALKLVYIPETATEKKKTRSVSTGCSVKIH